MTAIQTGYSSTDLTGAYWPLEAVQTSSATGTQNNFTINTTTSVLILSGAAPVITGFTGGRSGRLLLVIYTGAGTLTINNQDTNSTASNRVIGPAAAAFAIIPNSRILLIYDGASSRWRTSTFPDRTLSETITGTWTFSSPPVASGASITNLNGANISTGQIPVARMGTGTANSSKVLLGDGTWGDYNMFLASMVQDVSFGSTETSHNIDISSLGVADVKEIIVLSYGPPGVRSNGSTQAQKDYAIWIAKPTSTTSLTIRRTVVSSGDGASADASDVDLNPSTHSFFIARIRVP